MENLIKIMLVDDDPAITSILKTKLEKTGKFSVVLTNESTEALRMAQDEQPNLIICDIDMPDMSGGDVARAIFDAEDTKKIPVLFLSSIVAESDVKNGMVGKQHMISKSSDINKLIAKIESMLNS